MLGTSPRNDDALLVLLAAYLWQLMRYNMLQLLKNLKLHMGEVADGDILQWANAKVRSVGKTSSMESFKVNCCQKPEALCLGSSEPPLQNFY